jgi:soluble lytic murein transglycosylase-like protein
MILHNRCFASLRIKIRLKFLLAGLALSSILFFYGAASAPVVEAGVINTAVAVRALIPSSGDAQIDRFIIESGTKHGVDPKLIYYVIRQESNFKPRARSGKDAQGLMQMIPATAERFHVEDAWDPQQNIEGGARYLRWLLKEFKGDVRLALAGYNAGEGAVKKRGNQVPEYQETQNYVKKITAAYGKTHHPVLSPEEASVEFGLVAAE